MCIRDRSRAQRDLRAVPGGLGKLCAHAADLIDGPLARLRQGDTGAATQAALDRAASLAAEVDARGLAGAERWVVRQLEGLTGPEREARLRRASAVQRLLVGVRDVPQVRAVLEALAAGDYPAALRAAREAERALR